MEEYLPPTTKIPFQSDKEYHVFLSFRGEDVRKTLVDHLYEALTAAGLSVFLDSHKLEKGEIIGLSLERAVESSAIRIPIFSNGYADSTWCLREAVAMLKTPGLIIPLFYDVLPTEVRYPLKDSSPYKPAFQKRYGQLDRYAIEEIDGWKDALKEICARSGWSMDLTGGFEAQIVKRVVNDMIKTFDRVPLEIAKHPVGLKSVTKALIHKFKLNSEGSVVKAGIWGIGGIGKTTLAKALFNQVYACFDASCFVFNVRTIAADSMGLTKLQQQILKDLCKYDEVVHSVDNGISLFRDRLGRKRVLLILDDVDGVDQSNALVGDWLATGSRVIITTRNRHVLHVAQVSPQYIHEMSGLQTNESLHLFSWHAFLRASPTPTHHDLSKRIVMACKGHPLSLEVIGAFLYDKQNDIDCWNETVDNVTRNPDIQKTLYISYTALSEEEKNIYLDVACFLVGEHKKYPIIFWKALYRMVHSAINNLSLRLLIKINDNGVFDMHDHLRDMGRSIAEKEGTRLWKADHLNRGVINNNNFSCLRLIGGNSQRLETLYGPALQYLHLENLAIDATRQPTLPHSLVWIRLKNCSFTMQKSFQSSGVMRYIRRFAGQGSSHFSLEDRIWDLRILQVDGEIANFQYSLCNILGNLSQLQHLELRGCTTLNNLPDSIGNLSQLQQLDLGGCKELNKLPHTIGNLSQLQDLNLADCTKLNKLPDTIGELSKLQSLDLARIYKLNKLPCTIGNLLQLQRLDLRGCSELEQLPDTIGKLSQLQHLDLAVCTKLKKLPCSIGNLSQLQQLILSSCTKLITLPNTIGKLSQLQHLDLDGCENLNNLPDIIGNQSTLQCLDLVSCKKLTNIPDTIGNLAQLQQLYLRFCENLTNLPNTIGNLLQLQHLNLYRCIHLNSLPDSIGNLLQLQHLDLSWCQKLYNVPDVIGNLSQLQRLDFYCCTNLNGLPDTIGNLSQLQCLNMTWCESLNSLPDTIGNLSKLQRLYMDYCKNLKNLPNTIGNLSQLQYLSLQMCARLNRLPDTIGNLLQLQELVLSSCENLNSLPDTIGNLSQLQTLTLPKCERLNNLPDSIGNLSQLKHLYIYECTNLKACLIPLATYHS